MLINLCSARVMFAYDFSLIDSYNKIDCSIVIFYQDEILRKQPTQNLSFDANQIQIKRNNQLSHKYNDLKQHIFLNFNLQSDTVSDFLLNKINKYDLSESNIFSVAIANPGDVLACINHFFPNQGLKWIVSNFLKFNPIGRVRIIESLRLCDCVESYQILQLLLDDKSYAPNSSIRTTKIMQYRVCDRAFKILEMMILFNNKETVRKTGYFQNQKKYDMNSSLPINLRNENIEYLKKWWVHNKDLILMAKEHRHDSTFLPLLSKAIQSQKRIESLYKED